MKRSLLATSIALTMFSAIAQETPNNKAIETVTIYGNQLKAQEATGAAQYIGEQDLEKFAYTDIQRIIRLSLIHI